MKFLLTGACGFIGSNVALNLLNEGHTILNLDKLTYAANTKDFKSINYNLIHIDISKLWDYPLVIDQIKEFQPDYVIHFAAESMVDRSLANNRVFFDSNVIGTWAILELLKILPIKKAIFFSTDEVYGSLHHALEDPTLGNKFYRGFRETERVDPRNPYAGSKAAADQITISYTHNFNLPICIVRPTNNYGPRQDKEKFIPKAITNILLRRKVPIFGSGNYYREWLYVDDTYTALNVILEKGRLGMVYNIGSANRCSNLTLLETICELLNTPHETPLVAFNDVIEHVTDRQGHDVAYAVDSTAIRNLGWEPKTTLRDGLASTINYYWHLLQ